MIPEKDWKWIGTAGHFICGQWCRFHLTTLIGNMLVSTIGQYVHPRHSGGHEVEEAEWLAKNPHGEEIGPGRKYETMSFKAGKPCTGKRCGCGLPTIKSSEIEYGCYNDAKAATKGHMAICKKVAQTAKKVKRRV